jgi:nucleotide-binding universal stress UspA family protein
MLDVSSLPERFVVPLDGSDFAQRAVEFADRWAAELDIELELMTTPQTTDRDARTVAPSWLAEATHGLSTSKVSTRYIDADDPVAAILETTQERPQTWLCMATHGRGLVLGSALGHVAEHVVRKLAVPAMLIGPRCETTRRGPVMVCHDGSRLADAVLDVAFAWATSMGAPIRLVHAIHPLDVETPHATPPEVKAAATRLGTNALICRGPSPTAALLDAADELRPSIVALTTHGRSGIARIALGSVATKQRSSSRRPHAHSWSYDRVTVTSGRSHESQRRRPNRHQRPPCRCSRLTTAATAA